MFDRFTSRARLALEVARHEAQGPGGAGLPPEYVLLGLLERDCGALRIIEQLGTDVGVLRAEILTSVESATCAPASLAADEMLRILELAMEEAGDGVEQYIGTEHLLAALLRPTDNLAADLLRSHGILLDKVREAAINLPGPDGEAPRG